MFLQLSACLPVGRNATNSVYSSLSGICGIRIHLRPYKSVP
ncbi:MAG: hypothetical protein WCV41_04950 [Patescibacteria group bacterium]